MDKAICIEISQQPLDIQRGCAFVSDPAHGAVNTFLGMVRNHHEGKAVTGITYDIHAELAANVLEQICREAIGFWPETRYYVAHYQGALKVGEISVVIAVGAAHRAPSFEGCRYVIEELKKRAPVWKQEHYTSGKSAWLPGHALSASTETGMGQCGTDHAAEK